MMMIIVNLIGLLLIGAIVWWFWLSRNNHNVVQVVDLIEITVKDGVYKPAYIQAQVGRPITLRFIRKDASPCAEVVVFASLNISQQLPLSKPTDIHLKVKNVGEYEFTCQMGMYRGKLLVK